MVQDRANWGVLGRPAKFTYAFATVLRVSKSIVDPQPFATTLKYIATRANYTSHLQYSPNQVIHFAVFAKQPPTHDMLMHGKP